MKHLSFYFIAILLIGLQSCQKDIIGEEQDLEVITTEPTVTISSGFSGIVVDEDQNPIEGVEISYSRQTYTTDQNGYFIVIDAKAPAEGGFLSLKKEGFFNNYKFFYPENGSFAFQRVMMIESQESGKFDANAGGAIELEGGAKITFPTEAIVNQNDLPYAGEVTVRAHWYNPTDTDITQSMPGDLRGNSLDGKIVQLATFGMMAVELYGSSGEELNLNDETMATLDFPIPERLSNTAPAEIPVWSLDESTGYWIEETSASLTEEFYRVQVSHFSFWNCDVPYPLVNIFGKLVDDKGSALPFYEMCIEAPNLGMVGYGWTNSEGSFNGKVPKNEPLVLKVKDECGNVVLEREIGPFSSDASFGEIVINTAKQIKIEGRLVCDGQAVSDGYVKVSVNNSSYYIFETDENGYFDGYIIACDTERIVVTGVDRENNRVSEPVDYNVGNETEIDFGNIQSCETLDEYIRYKLNQSQEYLNVNPSACLEGNKLTLGTAMDSFNYITLTIDMPQLGSQNSVSSLTAWLYDTNASSYQEVVCNNNFNCNEIEVIFTQLGSVSGEYVEGTIMGEDNNGRSIMGSFRIRLDEKPEELRCNMTMIESDGCGANANGAINIEISQGTPPFELLAEFTPFGSNQVQVIDGTFEENLIGIEGLETGEIRVTVVDANNNICESEIRIGGVQIEVYIDTDNIPCVQGEYSATAVVVGDGSGQYLYEWNNGVSTNDSIINNLTSDTLIVEVTDLVTGCTAVGITAIGGPAGNFSCQIESLNVSCNPEGGRAAVFAYGGSNEYSYEWSNGATTQEIEDLSPGVYSVFVIDNNTGCITSCEVEISQIEELQVDIEGLDVISCNSSQLFLAVAPYGGVPPYNILWSTGDTTDYIDNLMPNQNYSVTVTDQSGCEVVENPTTGIIQELLDMEFSYTLEQCINGIPYGTITAFPIGGTPPFSYEWSDGSTKETFEEGEVGPTYTVTIIDANDCQATRSVMYDPGDTYQTISGYAWLDNSELGIQDVFDNQDEVLQGIEVLLLDANDFNNVIASAVTDDEGKYSFNVENAGDFVVQIPFQDATEIYDVVGYKQGNDPDRDNELSVDLVTETLDYDGCILEWINIGFRNP